MAGAGVMQSKIENHQGWGPRKSIPHAVYSGINTVLDGLKVEFSSKKLLLKHCNDNYSCLSSFLTIHECIDLAFYIYIYIKYRTYGAYDFLYMLGIIHLLRVNSVHNVVQKASCST